LGLKSYQDCSSLNNNYSVHAVVHGDSTGPTNGTQSEKVWETLLHVFLCLGCKDFVIFAMFCLYYCS